MVLEQSKSLVLGNLLQRLNENLRKEAQLFYKSQNIDFEPKWFPVVYVLSQKKAISVVELSQEIGYSHPTTISLLKELEKKELIGSAKDAKDERKRLITLTDKANEMIDQLQPLWQIMTEALIELTDTENNLFKAIHEVTQNLKTKNLFDRMTTIKEMKSESAQKSTGNTVKVEKIEDSKLIEIAFAIRRQVFVEEQNVSQERESMDDEEAVHYLATVNGLPAGAARYRQMEKGFKIERIAVLNTYRGKRIGEAILQKILADLKDEEKIYLYAQVNASRFYIKNGFKQTDNFFLDAGIEHVEMDYVKK
ncbi:bifunctional helix-turn-helix transcriptional regulator/GNAT family N-acetyltransferase [Flavobacterium tructae]|uniref:GNAT family N-acetyltransferase n=1 Tax=Flavobacterium tructae TaxID=1114873 RepID=UPI002551E73A|nr:bifunctional helix-turn-helix transcriptional regulator/GNAT family N-acetyltransferase [Flavobacterium tructae]MDL2142698.1 bifunctional helix-turn-helix transcriptional regulator/GNAT family N-acetyltransferase [Flavobacterium tructae]